MNLPKHLSDLSPSKNAGTGLLELARQIANRDELNLEEVLSSEEIIKVCEKEKLGRKDKLRSVRLHLEQRRFPVLKEIEVELTDLTRKIQKEVGLSVELPSDLEGDTLSFKIKARSPEELELASKRFQALADKDEMKRIFSILAGDF